MTVALLFALFSTPASAKEPTSPTIECGARHLAVLEDRVLTESDLYRLYKAVSFCGYALGVETKQAWAAREQAREALDELLTYVPPDSTKRHAEKRAKLVEQRDEAEAAGDKLVARQLQLQIDALNPEAEAPASEAKLARAKQDFVVADEKHAALYEVFLVHVDQLEQIGKLRAYRCEADGESQELCDHYGRPFDLTGYGWGRSDEKVR